MDPRFNDIFTRPENSIFRVVFYPDRVYHDRYLNAARRSPRYRYNVQEVRSKLDINVLKGEVYLDGVKLCNFLRLEYCASRLAEQVRDKRRPIQGDMLAWLQLLPKGSETGPEAIVRLHYCRFTDAYQIELWGTLEPPAGTYHDMAVLDMMNKEGPITRVPAFDGPLTDIAALVRLDLAFRENDRYLPYGYEIKDPEWDNNYLSSHQCPCVARPSAPENTLSDKNYRIDFQRGFFLQASETEPVRYVNAMMDPDNPDARPDNIVEMRWLLQRELGGPVVFFHEVTIPPGAVEGTHQHIGTEEVYYIVEGAGTAYIAAVDDPATAHLPTVERHIYGLGKRPCKELPVKKGSVIYTKSGGMHGIRNPNQEPLKFVAFLYHTR